MSEPEPHDLSSVPLEGLPTTVAMEATRARGWKLYVGLALFVYSFGTLAIAAAIPFLFSPALAATLATCVVVSGEIGFWVSAALLGRPFIDALKARLGAILVRQRSPAPRTVSRARHVFGLVLFSLSFVSYYVAMATPFLRLTKNTELATIVVVAIAGEVLFVSSLFVLGGEFWERIKALYRWPGQLDTAGAPDQACSLPRSEASTSAATRSPDRTAPSM
jgi:hypothetical protein